MIGLGSCKGKSSIVLSIISLWPTGEITAVMNEHILRKLVHLIPLIVPKGIVAHEI